MMRTRVATPALCALLLAGCSDARPDHRSEAEASIPAGARGAAAASPLDSLLASGEALYMRDQFDSARTIWQAVLRRAERDDDRVAEPRALTWLGLAAWRQGNHPEARALGERALALKLERELGPDLFRSFNALGLLAWKEGRLGDAASLLEQGLATARAHGDHSGVARASANLALVHSALGEVERARQGFRAARDAGRGLGDARLEGNALANLAMLEIWAGDPAAAIPLLEEARRRYDAIGYALGEVNALGHLGSAYAALGEPRLAFVALHSAIELARTRGHHTEEAELLELMAGLYRDAGDRPRALRLLSQARGVYADAGWRVEEGRALRSEAAIHAALGNFEAARSRLHDALRIHEHTETPFETLDGLLLLTEVAHASGSAHEAAAHLGQAGRWVEKLDTRLARARFALTAARLADRARDDDGVLRRLDGAEWDLVGGIAELEWEAHALRARALARQGRLEAAAAAGRRSLAAVERVRGSFAGGPLRTGYAADKSSVYAELVVVLLRLGRADEAFEIADAARGRALIEHLSSARTHARVGTLVGELAEAEALLRRIDRLLEQIDELEQSPPDERAVTATAASDLAARLADARHAYESHLVRVAHRDPAPATLLGARRVSVADVRAALRPGELLLEYLATPERVLIFAVTRNEVRTLESSVSAAALANRVRLARDLFGQRTASPAASEPVARALHDALIRPVRETGALAGVGRIIVVPHGSLTYLPFAALLDASTGRYLAEDHVISYLPSAGALPLLRAEQPAGAKRPREHRRATAFAPLPDRLPATVREAEAVRDILGRARVHTGRAATEGEVRRALAAGGIVHIATHGVMNSRNPMFSRISLARGGSGPADDGRLEVHELLGMRVRSSLVFLSGCETGLGSAAADAFHAGEDFATLGQAFLFAGAGNVVATLWRIEDDGAADFAVRFYRNHRTLPPAAALAAAQRETLRDPRYRHPYYWAAYTLSGGGDLLAATRHRSLPSLLR